MSTRQRGEGALQGNLESVPLGPSVLTPEFLRIWMPWGTCKLPRAPPPPACLWGGPLPA